MVYHVRATGALPRAAAFAALAGLVMLGCNEGTQEKIVTVHDTLTVRDTVRISNGRPAPFWVFGIVADMLSLNDSVTIADSMCAFFSLSASRPIRSAVVSCAGHVLDYDDNQQLRSFFNGFYRGADLFPTLLTSQYEKFFRDTARTLPCSVIIPYYQSETSSALLHDTLADAVARPGVLDTIRFFDSSGRRYESIDYFRTTVQPKRIRLDQDLRAAWKRTQASWFAVECVKYIDYSYTYGAVGDPLDTFVRDTQIVLPRSYFFQDTATDSTKRYDFLYVAVVPVNGPSPASWDSCGSFGGKGDLFAIHYKTTYATVNCVPSSVVSKRLAKRAAGKVPSEFMNGVNVLGRCMKRHSR